jgi:23S rRNA (pseudouridine1915-N3)-methyltransferase
MKIAFWYSGNETSRELAAVIAAYEKRLRRYIQLEQQLIPLPKGQEGDKRAIKERDKVLKQLKQGDTLILLDEQGKKLTSKGFADYLQNQLNTAQQRIIFLAGASHGFHEDLRNRADNKLALSSLTMNHEHARLIFMEQLYRVFTIIHNAPYHH